MSILHDLLIKVRPRGRSGKVSPQLEQLHNKDKVNRKKYLRFLIISGVFLFSGILILYSLNIFLPLYKPEKKIKNKSPLLTSSSETKKEKKEGPLNAIDITEVPKKSENVPQSNRNNNISSPEKNELVSRFKKLIQEKQENEEIPEAQLKQHGIKQTSRSRSEKEQTSELKKLSKNKSEYEKIDKISEKNYYVHTGIKYEQLSKFGEAKTAYLKALNFDRTDCRLVNKIAYLHFKTGNYHDAVKYARDAIYLKNDYIPALINLALSLVKIRDTSGAEKNLRKAVILEPDNTVALFNLALIYEKTDRLEGANRIYGRLAEKGMWNATLSLARVKEKLGETEKAIELYAKVIKGVGVSEDIRSYAKNRFFKLTSK